MKVLKTAESSGKTHQQITYYVKFNLSFHSSLCIRFERKLQSRRTMVEINKAKKKKKTLHKFSEENSIKVNKIKQRYGKAENIQWRGLERLLSG